MGASLELARPGSCCVRLQFGYWDEAGTHVGPTSPLPLLLLFMGRSTQERLMPTGHSFPQSGCCPAAGA